MLEYNMTQKIAVIIIFTSFVFGVFWSLKSEQTIFYQSQPLISPKITPKTPEIILRFFGDAMFDRGVKSSVAKNFEGDGVKLFGPSKELIENADIAFLNLEGPISDRGRNVGSIYSFRFDPVYTDILQNTGIDIVSFANNHVGDYSYVAFKDTLAHLENVGIKQTGAGINYSDARTAREIIIHDTKFCFLGFSDVGPNWIKATENSAGILLASDPEFENIIKNAKLSCDILIISFHWGEEYKKFNTRQEKLAKSAIDSGADLIIGHHPHVAQDIEIYNGKIIVYSLGNFIFDQYFSPETLEGLNVEIIVQDKNIKRLLWRKTYQSRKYNIESISKQVEIDLTTDKIVKIQK